MGILGIVAFIVALLFSVMIHEFGHYLMARRFNMKVTEFFLGFGKRIWSFRKGETEFGIKAIPAGGYCRITGMTIHEELSAAEKPRAFYQASVPKRLLVLGAGSFLHLVLGFIILTIIIGGIGTSIVTNRIDQVLPCVTNTSDGPTLGDCKPDSTKSPANIAGLQSGDEIIKIGGIQVTGNNWNKAIQVIHNSPNKTLEIVVRRDGENQTFTVIPRAKRVGKKDYGFIGIVNTFGTKRENPIATVRDSALITKDVAVNSVTSLFSLPSKIPALIKQTLGEQKRDPNGLVGVVGVARVSAQTASDPKMKWRDKLTTFLMIIASLNIFVGIFNLFPLLPMDGGHMAIAVIDGFRRWRARTKSEPRPHPFDIEKLMPFTLTVIVFLVGLTLLLLAADIFHPVSINP
jgi:membrane-associated protease RseP (regulator of RpoE activity)